MIKLAAEIDDPHASPFSVYRFAAYCGLKFIATPLMHRRRWYNT
jgi:hypothetical protein